MGNSWAVVALVLLVGLQRPGIAADKPTFFQRLPWLTRKADPGPRPATRLVGAQRRSSAAPARTTSGRQERSTWSMRGLSREASKMWNNTRKMVSPKRKAASPGRKKQTGASPRRWSLSRLFGSKEPAAKPRTVSEWISQDRLYP